MRLGRPEPRQEAIYRLGGSPQVGQAVINRHGVVGVVVPFRDDDDTEGNLRVEANGDGHHILHRDGLYSWAFMQQTGWRYLEPASRYKKIGDSWVRWCTPFDIRVSPIGVLTGTVGNSEMEMAAAVIVAFHQENTLPDWSPLPRASMVDWAKSSGRVKRWEQNPVWRPDFQALVTDGHVKGWGLDDADDAGMVTAKFVECLATPRVGGFPRIKRVLSK